MNPRPLSPAAQAVLDAAAGGPVPDSAAFAPLRLEVAGAVRALADQVVPEEADYMRAAIPDTSWWDKHDLVRWEILGIANELDPPQPEQP